MLSTGGLVWRSVCVRDVGWFVMFSLKCLRLSGGFGLPLWVKINILSAKLLMTDNRTTCAVSVGVTEILTA